MPLLLLLASAGLGNQLISHLVDGGATLLLGLILWGIRTIANTLKSAHTKLDHLDECMDDVKKESKSDRLAIALHRVEADARDHQIAQLRVDYGALAGWVKGRNGMAFDAELTEISARPPEREPKV